MTSTSKTTVLHRSAANMHVLDRLELAATRPRRRSRRRRNSLVYVQELGIYSIRDTGSTNLVFYIFALAYTDCQSIVCTNARFDYSLCTDLARSERCLLLPLIFRHMPSTRTLFSTFHISQKRRHPNWTLEDIP